jgi:hypothetical protein
MGQQMGWYTVVLPATWLIADLQPEAGRLSDSADQTEPEKKSAVVAISSTLVATKSRP